MFKIVILFLFLALIQSIDSKISYKTQFQKPCEKSKAILFKENVKSHRMIEFVFLNESITDCFIYGNKQLAEKVISTKSCQPKQVFVTRKQLSKWARICSDWLSNQMKKGVLPSYSDEDFPEQYNDKISRNFFDGLLIFPGTKWCGAGDISEHFDDLGEETEAGEWTHIDKCCRSHDHCFDSLPSGETKYDLTNKAIHTKSHCECDNQFKQCLISIDRTVPDVIAELYFNLIQIQCFKKDHPIIKCLEWKGIPLFWESCQKYFLDLNKPQIYQFFDAIFVD